MDGVYNSGEAFFGKPKVTEDEKNRKADEKKIIKEYLQKRVKFYQSLDSIETIEDIKINKKVCKELRNIIKGL